MSRKNYARRALMALSALAIVLASFSFHACVAEKQGVSPSRQARRGDVLDIYTVKKMRDQAVSPHVGRWAVVVGISDYRFDKKWDQRHGIPDLQYAHRDAQAFADFLLSPAGGAFSPDKVVLLTDGQATVKEVRKAVGTFLAKSLEDDLVIFYFAGHGAADPDNPKNLYLLCHDTEPGNFFGTAFPMWDVDTVISRRIKSQKVLVLTDACHAAGVGLRGNESVSRFNAYMSKLAESRQGVTKITASRADELSQEKFFPGAGGHGVFTFHLLEGLKGAADRNRDGFVTMAEAYDHVYDRVRSDTQHSQRPWASAYVSDDIPIGVVDRQVLAAIEARAKAGGKTYQPAGAPVEPPRVELDVPDDSGVALKLAEAKRAKGEPAAAFALVDAVAVRKDKYEPQALSMKIEGLLEQDDLARAENAEDLLSIKYPDHPAAKKAGGDVYEYYRKQAGDASPKGQIQQIEKYLKRHPSGLVRKQAEADLSKIRSDIRDRYEKLFRELLVLAEGFMSQNRFDRSREALEKAEGIAGEALREHGIGLDATAVEDLKGKASAMEFQAGQDESFEETERVAARQELEERLKTWEAFVENNPGNPHVDDVRKKLAAVRSKLKVRLQKRFDLFLKDAERALDSRNFAAAEKKLGQASMVSANAQDRLGIRLDTGNLASLETRRQREARAPRVSTVTSQVASARGDRIKNDLGMEFVYIPPGSFSMGSPSSEPKRDGDEKQHRVTLTKSFYLQTTEVNQGQWEAVMGNNPSRFKDCGRNCPVERVSWNDIQEFIKKLNAREGANIYRLPTEAEWEYAARAGTTTPFSFGSCLSTDQANYNGNYPMPGCSKGRYREMTVPVASFSPNAWGLYDMHGNVWEWCQDWFGDYPSGAVTDPAGAKSGSVRVLRGGSWIEQRLVAAVRPTATGAGRPTASRSSAFAWPGFQVFSKKSL